MPQTTLELLRAGIEANRADALRRGNLIQLPAEGHVVVAGDIHGHRRNFERIVGFADLDNNPDTHVVLQEIIHGGPEDRRGGCLSYTLLLDVIRYKLRHPDRVHVIMGNHDTACIAGTEVMKDGREMNRAMAAAIAGAFPDAGDQVQETIRQLLLSQPLAVRCENRVWISHSLPSDRFISRFEPRVIQRKLTAEDCRKPGSAYLLTWGRRHSQALLDTATRMFDADVFILGHQPQPQGWARVGENLIILASDHNHGCILSLDLSKTYTADELTESVVRLAAIP